MSLSWSVDERLRFAVANKRRIQVTYNGRVRVAEPHDYGIQNGTSKLLIYQVRSAGGVGRTPAIGWRLLEVSKIEGLVVLEETFRGSRGRSYRHHTRWDEIFVRVA